MNLRNTIKKVLKEDDNSNIAKHDIVLILEQSYHKPYMVRAIIIEQGYSLDSGMRSGSYEPKELYNKYDNVVWVDNSLASSDKNAHRTAFEILNK